MSNNSEIKNRVKFKIIYILIYNWSDYFEVEAVLPFDDYV